MSKELGLNWSRTRLLGSPHGGSLVWRTYYWKLTLKEEGVNSKARIITIITELYFTDKEPDINGSSIQTIDTNIRPIMGESK